MNPDAASLDNLRDIALPPAVPWWPLAPGWWVLTIALLFAVFWVAFRALQNWRAGAHRRAALSELERANSVSGIAAILKRTALVEHSRSEVAALSGSAWQQWLSKTRDAPLPAAIAAALAPGIYAGDPANIEELRTFAIDWIRHHKTEVSTSPSPRESE